MKSLVLIQICVVRKLQGEYKAHDECSHEKKTIFNLVDPINLESLWIFTNNSVCWKIEEIHTKDEHHIIKLLL